MTKQQRESQVRHIKDEANSPKSRLIDLHRELVSIGALRDARGLESIIGRLEAWQNR